MTISFNPRANSARNTPTATARSRRSPAQSTRSNDQKKTDSVRSQDQILRQKTKKLIQATKDVCLSRHCKIYPATTSTFFRYKKTDGIQNDTITSKGKNKIHL